MNYQFRSLTVWPRAFAQDQRPSQFSSTYSSTLQLLEKELNFIDARHVVIELAVPSDQIRNDGLPRSTARPTHPGVIVSFDLPCYINGKWATRPLNMPCDSFTKWQDNLRAIALTLEALRKINRYGVTQGGEQYKGWAALPEPEPKTDLAKVGDAVAFVARHSETGIAPSKLLKSAEQTKNAYRAAARRLHPDVGGNEEDFKNLQTAYETLNRHHQQK